MNNPAMALSDAEPDRPERINCFDFAARVDRDIEGLTATAGRLRKGRAKRLLEELLPISRLALALKTPGLAVDVVAHENSGAVDGHIWISGYRQAEFDIEVTCTHGEENNGAWS